jgi:hypothetical protein
VSRELLFPWFTGAAISLLLLINVVQPSLLVVGVAGALAAVGLALFPEYRRRGAAALLIAGAVASVIATAIRLSSG